MKYLVVVDMQNDFITGSLGTAEAKAIVDRVRDKLDAFSGRVVFTQDSHGEDYLSTQEGRLLPVKHCIRGSWGWQIEESLRPYVGKVFEKPTFASVELAKYLAAAGDVESIELVGLCTDICVVSNALTFKGFMPEVPIIVDSSCCAGVTVERHNAALQTMRSCQIAVI